MYAGVGFLVVELGKNAQQRRMRVRRRAQELLERLALVAIGRLQYGEQLLPGTPGVGSNGIGTSKQAQK